MDDQYWLSLTFEDELEHSSNLEAKSSHVNLERENEIMITTTDNPWNPYTNWDEWYQYDTEGAGYYTYQRLAKLAFTVSGDSDENNALALTNAMYDLIDLFDRLNKMIENSGQTSIFPHYTLAERPKTEGNGK